MSSKGFDTGSILSDVNDSYTVACGSNSAGFLAAEGATAASYTTGWPDYGDVARSSYANFPHVGGSSLSSDSIGLFSASVDNASTKSRDTECARLSFRG